MWNRLTRRNALAISAVAGASLWLLAGCSGPATDDRPPEEIVKERAEARWAALVGGNADEAYAFASPAFRNTTSIERHRGRFAGAVRWSGAEVESVNCEEDRCAVVVNVTYKARGARFNYENTRPMEEVWIHSDGQWWIHLQ